MGCMVKCVKNALKSFPGLEELRLVNIAIGPKAARYKEVHGDKLRTRLSLRSREEDKYKLQIPKVSFDLANKE